MPRGARCGACRRHKPAIDALEFEWLYAAPLDTVVAALKFRRLRFLAPQLGHRLAGSIGGRLREALADGGPNTQEPLVTWVPLHWRRRALRSFDQAEGIARALAAGLCLPVIPTLTRRRATAPQSRSGARGRGMGVRGAFRPRSLGAVRGRSILLVDDVVTTGATLEAAARSLRRAGASRIVAAVVARTPGPSESP